MPKLTSEERHKKQLAKIQSEAAQETQFYQEEKSEKQKIVEKLIKMGYQYEISSGIPIFKVQTDEEVDLIRTEVGGRFSFGYRMPTRKGSAE